MRLLQIIVDNNCDMGVRQVASIHFKNFIAKNWSPHDSASASATATADAPSTHAHAISPADKDLVRDHILLFVAQVPPLLRSAPIPSTFLLSF